MNEITIHGNLTAEPVTHRKADRIAVTFGVAVNNGYFDQRAGRWVKQGTVYHKVACFGALAGNAAATLRKGATVTVSGQLADDSYTDEGGQQIRRTRLVATDVAVSLRWATATITRRARDDEADQPTDAEPPAALAADEPSAAPTTDPATDPTTAEPAAAKPARTKRATAKPATAKPAAQPAETEPASDAA